jgi:hypothetical protein
MSTRSRGTLAFEHVIANVLGLFGDSQLVLALVHQEGYDSITDLATMTDAEIEGLQYNQETKVNEDGEEVIRQALKPVIKKQRKQLKHLLYWRDWKSRQLNNFTHEEWMNLTSESLENFCNQTLPDIIRGSSSSSSAGRSAGQNVVTSSEVA